MWSVFRQALDDHGKGPSMRNDRGRKEDEPEVRPRRKGILLLFGDLQDHLRQGPTQVRAPQLAAMSGEPEDSISKVPPYLRMDRISLPYVGARA